MKRILPVTMLLSFFMSTGTFLHAQTLVNKVWQDTTGNPQDTTTLSFAERDGSSSYVLVGNTWPTSDSEQILITKYTNSGTKLWQVRSASISTKRAIATGIDINNGYIYLSSTSYDSTNSKSTFSLAKLVDSSGSTVWQKQYTPTFAGYAVPAAVRGDNSGNVYIAGTEQVNDSSYEMTILKYSNSGTVLWTVHYDSAGLYSGAVGVGTINAKDSVSFAVSGFSGKTFGTWDIVTFEVSLSTGGITNVHRVSNGSGSFVSHPVAVTKDTFENTYIVGASEVAGINIDIKLIKYDSLFNQVWIKTWGASDSLADVPVYMVNDAAQNLIITGYTTHANGEVDLLVAKYNGSGTLLWSKTVNPPNTSSIHYAIGNSVAVDPSSNIYVTGETYNGTNYDIITLAFDPNGRTLWEKTYDGGGNDVGNNISLDLAGNIYVSGTSTTGASSKYITISYSSITFIPSIVNSASGAANYISDELIISFARSEITTSYVDNTDLQYVSLTKLVQDTALLSLMKTKTGVDFTTATAVKIHKKFHSYDTLSISRLGDTVNMGPFWTTFLISHAKLSGSATEITLADSLNTIGSKISYAEPNVVYTLNTFPDDSLFSIQNSLYPTNPAYDSAHINVSPAWALQKGNNNIKVGIYDSGIMWNHSDFSFDGSNTLLGSTVVGGWSWTNNSDISSAVDIVGHGTACAGIVGAVSDNLHGIAGIAGGDKSVGKIGCQLFDMQISDSTASSVSSFVSDDKVVAAITEGSYYHPGGNPVGYGLHIMNASWGWQGSTSANSLAVALRSAFLNQVVFVTSRGNLTAFSTSDSDIQYPACLRDDWVISVGGTGTNGQWKQVGNGNTGDTTDNKGTALIGFGVDVSAPATNAIVTSVSNVQNTYTGFNGTSSAAPHVAGLAALILAEQNVYGQYAAGNLANDDVQFLIKRYAKGYPSYDYKLGYGLINAGNALTNLQYPENQIQHSNPPITHTTTHVSSGNVDVPYPIGSVSGGIYTADVFKVTETFTDFFFSGYTVEDIWPVYSLTTGYNNVSPITDDAWQNFSGTITGGGSSDAVTSYMYAYHLTGVVGGGGVNYWIPADTNNIHAAYSIHLYNPSLTDVKDATPVTRSKGEFTLYPNPTSNAVHIDYTLTAQSPVFLQVSDITGKVVISEQYESQDPGTYHNSIDVSHLSQGMYICTMLMGTEHFEKKLVKLN